MRWEVQYTFLALNSLWVTQAQGHGQMRQRGAKEAFRPWPAASAGIQRFDFPWWAWSAWLIPGNTRKTERDDWVKSAWELRSVQSDFSDKLVYLHWPGRAVSQGADSVALDLLTQLPNHVDLGSPRVTFDETPHHIVHPVHAWGKETKWREEKKMHPWVWGRNHLL